jgi:hypothetical protein
VVSCALATACVVSHANRLCFYLRVIPRSVGGFGYCPIFTGLGDALKLAGLPNSQQSILIFGRLDPPPDWQGAALTLPSFALTFSSSTVVILISVVCSSTSVGLIFLTCGNA